MEYEMMGIFSGPDFHHQIDIEKTIGGVSLKVKSNRLLVISNSLMYKSSSLNPPNSFLAC